MVKDVVAMVGLDVGDRKISNLSLRVEAKNVQELIMQVRAAPKHRGSTSTLTWTGLPWWVVHLRLSLQVCLCLFLTRALSG